MMTNIVTFPQKAEKDIKSIPSIKIYGNRIHADQSLNEYLIEFLLIFASAKDVNGGDKLSFHKDEPLHYYVEPRNGFRRFVFYEHAKKNGVEQDKEAYEEIKHILSERLDAAKKDDKDRFLIAIQELYRGYAAVLKKRSWCAQSLLPMCPEMILCEEMPNEKNRKKGPSVTFENTVQPGFDSDATFYDSSFSLVQHNFMARGGELYYLHILQALENCDDKKTLLEQLLNNLLTAKSAEFSRLVKWVQGSWEDEKRIDPNYLTHIMNMGYIPAGSYLTSGKAAVDELITYLSNELHPVKRVELMAKGIMFQILRMLLERTAEYNNDKAYPIVVDMRSRKGGNIIRQLSVNSFNRVMDAFTTAINSCIEEDVVEADNAADYATFVKAKKETIDVFRAKGKELQCIIPNNGPFERFSLSEDITRFLVLSIVKPGEKMDLNHFLHILYVRYNLIIGPNEYISCGEYDNADKDMVNSFIYNKEAFQEFLKSAGFLRDLSDATSIVVNPYKEVELL